ncbi:MAG: ATP-dependent metallopeptidase FtsH/Yme1/Tma family protein, partial [Patescibacteria group bacterium]
MQPFMKNFSKQITWAFMILFVIAAAYSLFAGSLDNPQSVTLSELVAQMNDGKVATIVVKDNILEIALKDGGKEISQKEAEAGLSETLKNYGVQSDKLSAVSLEVQSASGFSFWMGVILPILAPI